MKKSFLYKLKLKAEIVTAMLIGTRPDCEVLDADDLFAVQYQRLWLDKSLAPFYTEIASFATDNREVQGRALSSGNQAYYGGICYELISARPDCMTGPSNWIFSKRCKTIQYVYVSLRQYRLAGVTYNVAIWSYV